MLRALRTTQIHVTSHRPHVCPPIPSLRFLPVAQKKKESFPPTFDVFHQVGDADVGAEVLAVPGLTGLSRSPRGPLDDAIGVLPHCVS